MSKKKIPKEISMVIHEFAVGVNKILNNKVKNIILYGSYARQEEAQNEEISDIDIMILVDLSEQEIKNIEEDVLNYAYDLDLKYNVLLSPIIENYDNYQRRKSYIGFYKNVEKEGVSINGK